MPTKKKNKINRPPDELLSMHAPLHIWRMAEKEAARSPHYRFKTGCVIYYGMGNGNIRTYSTGTAHPHSGSRRTYSIHAEMHAVSRLPPEHGGAVCLLVTLTKSGNYATNSRPCVNCATLLLKHTWGCVYAEMANDGSWAIRRESTENLLKGFLIPTKMNPDA